MDYITFISFFESRPGHLGDYTDPTKRKKRDAAGPSVLEPLKGPLVLEPLKGPDPRKYKTYQRWLYGDISNKEPRESGVGVFGVNWWANLKTPCAWLEDTVRYLFNLYGSIFQLTIFFVLII